MLHPTDHVIELVDDYLHDLLAPNDASVLEDHCENCKICRVALEEGRRRLALFPSVPAPPAPALLRQRAIGNVQAVGGGKVALRNRISFSVAYVVAAAVLVLATVHVFVYRLAPSPYDLRVLGQTELLTNSAAALRLAVFDHRSGELVPDVPVELHLINPSTRERNWLASINTSNLNAATTQFRLPKWAPGKYQLEVVARTSDGLEVIRHDVHLKQSWNVHLSTDKPVYQPGQTIRLRSLSLRRPELHPLVGEPVEFTIADPSGNLIFRKREVTSAYGLGAADCPLADEVTEGSYRIECRVGDSTTSRSVEVQKYVLPKFKITLDLERPFYAPGETVKGTLTAAYFFGKPVVEGNVELQALATDVTQTEIASLLLKTDAAGKMPFEFALPNQFVGLPREGGEARFRLAVKVTDSAGQSQTAAVSRVVTNQPIQLDVLPENGALVRDVANRVYVLARYADGRPAKAHVTATDFKSKTLISEFDTNEFGAAEFTLTPAADAVPVSVKAVDAAGLGGQIIPNLVCGGKSDDFLVRTDKAVYDGGEAITITALGGGLEPVFIDVMKDGQTVLTEVLELADGKASEPVTLPETVFGTVELVAYRFNASGEEVRKTRLLHVRPARQLKLNVTLAKEEFVPGEKTPLRITLTDAQGNPAVGAVSLAAVDEAVFSVLGQQGSLDQTFFLLQQQMLRPVYTLYNDWMPTPKPPASRQLLDLAVFSAAASSAEGRRILPANFTGAEEEPRERIFHMEAGDRASVQRLARLPVLSGTSFPEKEKLIERQRKQGLQSIWLAWGGLAIVVTVMGIVYVVLFVRGTLIHILIVLAIGTTIVAICVPSVQMAREAARRASIKNDLKQGAMAAGDTAAKAGEASPKAAEAARPAGEVAKGATEAAAPAAEKTAPIRTRDYFPETLLWRPEIITDASGSATVELELADSITTWRLSGSAVSAQGRLGSGEWPIKVFQSFFIDLNVPATLTRNDEVDVPVVVYNYLDRAQRVKLSIAPDKWFEFLKINDEPAAETFTLDLAAGEVRSLRVPIKVLTAGQHKLYLTAQGTSSSDRLERAIEVLPDGRRVEQVAGGTLDDPAEHAFEVPEMRVDGSTRCFVKLYPSTFSQVLDGLDGIFRMPSGCFEQTSSTTYPNVLALEYLKRTKTSSPALEAKARQFIHVGYQRLLTFEVPGGGFEWFGRAPANVALTAYGLAEFEDMAQLYDVEPALLARTRRWLLDQRLANGAWGGSGNDPRGGILAAGARQANKGDLATTAYVAAAVFSHGQAGDSAALTLNYLAEQSEKVENPYVLALVLRAMAEIDPNHEGLKGLAKRLDQLKKSDETGKLVWWELPAGTSTIFYGSGPSGNVETTAQALLALLAADRSAASARGAAAWLASQRDARGTWNTTQATVMALKALIEATGKTLADDKSRRAEIAVGGEVRFNAVIDADQTDVVRTIDITPEIKAGANRVTITDVSRAGMGYQLIVRYNVPVSAPNSEAGAPAGERRREPLAIRLEYDRKRLQVNEMVSVTAHVTNQLERTVPMAIVDLPIPAGFALKSDELDELVGSKIIERYSLTPRKAILYFRELAPSVPIELHYRLEATMPVKVHVPGGQAYLYYDPDVRGTSEPLTLEATSVKED